LPKSYFVTINIYNLSGQKIETLISCHQAAGDHQIRWIAESYPSGGYFYRFQAGEFSETKQLILKK
jgi:flagellar hook assembly protein FlgD